MAGGVAMTAGGLENRLTCCARRLHLARNPSEPLPCRSIPPSKSLPPTRRRWRREIHQHPELLYDVPRTASFVAERLRAFGCDEVATGIGRTGVVGVIRGRGAASGRTIGLRADMDALPIRGDDQPPLSLDQRRQDARLRS